MRILTDIRKRLPLQIARTVLKAGGFPSSNSWDKTTQTINGMTSDDDFSEREKVSVDAYEETLLCMNKTVYMYKLDESEMDGVREFVEDFEEESNDFADEFPYMLSDELLADQENNMLHLAKVQNWEGGTALTYCSKCSFSFREKYSQDEVSAVVARFFDGFDELIAIKHETLQLFHVVWVPDEGDYVQVRIDGALDMSSDMTRMIQRHLRDKFNSDYGEIVLNEPVNVFPAIQKIYDDGAEGRVVDMAFTTQTESQKRGKMRRGRGDLRSERFHVGGCAAVGGDIDPYQISVRWEAESFGYTYYPELLLSSSLKKSQASPPTLYEFAVVNAADIEDFESIVNAVVTHL